GLFASLIFTLCTEKWASASSNAVTTAGTKNSPMRDVGQAAPENAVGELRRRAGPMPRCRGRLFEQGGAINGEKAVSCHPITEARATHVAKPMPGPQLDEWQAGSCPKTPPPGAFPCFAPY